MKNTIYLILVSFVFVSCNAQNNAQPINTQEFINLEQTDSVLVIDVRTEGEVAEGYISGTDYFFNLNGAQFNESVAELDKEKTYIVYCRSGKRSSAAINYMASIGFTKLFELSGGILAWQDPNLILKP